MRRVVVLVLALLSVASGLVVAAAPASAATPELALLQTALDLGDVWMGTTGPAQQVTLANRGTTSVTLTGAYNPASGFLVGGTCKGATLAPSGKCTMTVAFRPTGVGDVTTILRPTFAGVELQIGVRARGLGLFSISPTGFDFGGVAVGSTAPQQAVTITNISGVPQVMSGAGGGAGVFGGSQNCQGHTLAPGASCQQFYAFRPTAVGTATGSTGGTWNGQSYGLAFKGVGLKGLSISPTSFDFGDVALGDTSPQQVVTITNRGTSPIVMNGAGGGAGLFGGSQNCQGHTLAPGASCQQSYAFTPSALGAASGTTGGTWNGQSYGLTFKGNGVPRLLISPTSLDFGEVPVGTTAPQQVVTITNRGGTPIVMNGSGGGAGLFGGSQNCQGHTLAPGASCQQSYAFSPSAAGVVNGATGGSWNGQSYTLHFTGKGITGARTQAFRISPTSFDFGSTALNNEAPGQAVTITNVSSAPIVGSIAGGGAGIFGGSQNCQGVTIQPGASCQVTYRFRPTALGAVNGSTNGSFNGQPFAFKFRGTGVRQWLISPVAFDFGDTRPGSSTPQSVTIVNEGTAAAVGSIAGGGAGQFGGSQNCQGVSIAAGSSCQVSYRFEPPTTGAATGTTNGSFNGQPFAFRFSGTGRPRWLISPTRFDFGDVALGATAPQQSARITNLGGNAAVGSIAGGGAGVFGGSQNCQGVSIAAGGSCQVNYAFHPSAPGKANGTTNGTFTGEPFAFTFSAYARRDLLASPTKLVFKALPVGATSGPLDVLVRNDSGHSLTLTATKPAVVSPFIVTTNCQNATLAAGASCVYRFSIRPQDTGSFTATYRPTVNGVQLKMTATGQGT